MTQRLQDTFSLIWSLQLFFQFFNQIQGNNYTCESAGKFINTDSKISYHQCFYLYGKLKHTLIECPLTTCFSNTKRFCDADACNETEVVLPPTILSSTTLPPTILSSTTLPPTILSSTTLSPTILPYSCKEVNYSCHEEGLYKYPKNPTIFIKCVKKECLYEAQCYTCNKKHDTCFSDKQNYCVTSSDKENCNCVDNPDPNLHDCEGYQDIPCSELGVGRHAHPGDRTIYFECFLDNGNLKGKCIACPNCCNSSYVEQKQACVENCDDGKKEYNCDSNTNLSYPCVKEGIFSNPTDLSLYYKCVFKDGKWESVCFPCNNLTKSCFVDGHCVTHTGKNCQNITNPTVKNDSLTHNCDGYGEFDNTCLLLGEGKFALPGDKSVYITCTKGVDGKFTSICSPCPKETNSCFNEHTQKCEPDCGKPTPTDDCTWNQNENSPFECQQEGYFSHPNDFSKYFHCIRSGESFQLLCHNCSDNPRTCFSLTSGGCIPCENITGNNTGGDAGGGEEPKPNNGTDPIFSHNCTGYDSLSFPCASVGVGTYANPSDKSTFFECALQDDGELKAVCKPCPVETNSCFIEELRTCVKNCGNERKPYNCDTYYDYPCEEEGYFVLSDDHSIFFHCSKIEGEFVSKCYTCNSVTQTCFDMDSQECVVDCNSDNKTLTLPVPSQCEGYGRTSIPCKSLSINIERNPYYFKHPGDKGVYFECLIENKVWSPKCYLCPPSTCFSQQIQPCDGSIQQGICNSNATTIVTPLKPTPYDCSQHDKKSHPCQARGFFAGKNDSSVFFQCVRSKQEYLSYCFACDEKINACFSNHAKRCLPMLDGKPCENRDPFLEGTDLSYRGYSCEGYGEEFSVNDKVFPCSKYGKGQFVHPGDRSIYFECDDRGNAWCNACNETKGACFEQTSRSCIDNCWGGEEEAKYDCTKYPWYNCTEDGLFANSKDTSVYYRCIKKKTGWFQRCYICSPKAKTCFNPDRHHCMRTRNNQCSGLANTSWIGSEKGSKDCNGFETIPCHSLQPTGIAHAWTTPGDQTVWMYCETDGIGRLRKNCDICAANTWFDPVQKNCSETENGPWRLTEAKCNKGPNWHPACLFAY